MSLRVVKEVGGVHLGDRLEDLVGDRGQDPLVVVEPQLCRRVGVRGRVQLVGKSPPPSPPTQQSWGLQGYLAHKKLRPPRTLP